MALLAHVSSEPMSRCCGVYVGWPLSAQEAVRRRAALLSQRELGIGTVTAKPSCAFEIVPNRVLRNCEPPQRWLPHCPGRMMSHEESLEPSD